MRRLSQHLSGRWVLAPITALTLLSACTRNITPVVSLSPVERQALDQSALVLISDEITNYEMSMSTSGGLSRAYFDMGPGVSDALDQMFHQAFREVEVRRNVGRAAQMQAVANASDLSQDYLVIPTLQATVEPGPFGTGIEVDISADFFNTETGQSTVLTAEGRDEARLGGLGGTAETAMKDAITDLRSQIFNILGSR